MESDPWHGEIIGQFQTKIGNNIRKSDAFTSCLCHIDGPYKLLVAGEAE